MSRTRVVRDVFQHSEMIGDFLLKMVSLTDDVLFGDVWERAELSKRDRSLVTVAALITGGNSEQLPFHLQRAKENGVTEAELIETITHLAFYSGWPRRCPQSQSPGRFSRSSNERYRRFQLMRVRFNRAKVGSTY